MRFPEVDDGAVALVGVVVADRFRPSPTWAAPTSSVGPPLATADSTTDSTQSVLTITRPAENLNNIECEERDLNPHGFYPTSPSN